MFRNKSLHLATVLCVAAAPAVSPAQDIAWSGDARPLLVASPPGFDAACRRYDWVCANRPGEISGLTEEQVLGVADEVNRQVNREVEQISDRENYGSVEKWTLPERGRGDCEDLALEKMRRLLDHGVPAERLSIAIALDRRGDNHAFLLLRVNGGYLVLDSLTNRLLGPDGTGYRMLAMQTADDRARWKITEKVVTAHLGGSAAPVAKAADDRRLALAEKMAVDR